MRACRRRMCTLPTWRHALSPHPTSPFLGEQEAIAAYVTPRGLPLYRSEYATGTSDIELEYWGAASYWATCTVVEDEAFFNEVGAAL